MAAELREEDGVEVETVRGGLGEFSVSVDGRKVVRTSRFWNPNPGEVVQKVRSSLKQ